MGFSEGQCPPPTSPTSVGSLKGLENPLNKGDAKVVGTGRAEWLGAAVVNN
jgi:hypothetical protein